MPNAALADVIASARDDRAEEEVAFGIIPCRIGEFTINVRTLKLAAAREWKSKLGANVQVTLSQFNVAGMGGAESIGSLVGLGVLGTEVMLELILEYDAAGALGGRKWLEENADESDIYRMFRQIIGVHFPFVADVVGMMTVLRTLMASTPPPPEEPEAPEQPAAPSPKRGPSAPGSSSSGASPSGTSGPTKLRAVSTRRS